MNQEFLKRNVFKITILIVLFVFFAYIFLRLFGFNINFHYNQDWNHQTDKWIGFDLKSDSKTVQNEIQMTNMPNIVAPEEFRLPLTVLMLDTIDTVSLMKHYTKETVDDLVGQVFIRLYPENRYQHEQVYKWNSGWKVGLSIPEMSKEKNQYILDKLNISLTMMSKNIPVELVDNNSPANIVFVFSDNTYEEALGKRAKLLGSGLIKLAPQSYCC